MKEREYLIELYETYKELLTKKQQMYFESYYYEDLSLNEIAINNGVSKALVSKNINNTINKLKIFEEKLKINYKEKKLKEIKSNIKDDNISKVIEEILYKY